MNKLKKISFGILIGILTISAGYFLIEFSVKDSKINENLNPSQKVSINNSGENIDKEIKIPKNNSGNFFDESGNLENSISGNICYLKNIAYSIGEKTITESCNEYLGQDCIKKTIECKIKLKNLDNETSGIFEGIISFFEKSKTENETISSSPFSEMLNPKNQIEVIVSTTITDPLIVSKEINCFYKTTSTPKKEIC